MIGSSDFDDSWGDRNFETTSLDAGGKKNPIRFEDSGEWS